MDSRYPGHLREHWYVAAASFELGRQPLQTILMDEPFVLFRDGRGTAVALPDRCLHRNAELSAGRVDGDCLQCPYHGWSYDSSGEVVQVPAEGGKPGTPRRLEPRATFEQDGYIWLWMGRDPRSPLPAEPPFRIPFLDAAGFGAYRRITLFENSVTNCVENFLDIPHTVFIHRGWFRRSEGRKLSATVERTDDSVLVEYFGETDNQGYLARFLNPRREPVVHTDRFFMPGISRVDYVFPGGRRFVITSISNPVAPLRTRVYTTITYSFGWLQPLARLLAGPYANVIIDQDVVILANQGRSLARKPASFQNTKADTIHVFIESLRERDGDEPPPAVKTQIEFWV